MTEMLDMARFIEAKSDQLNADDLIGMTKTITVTRVTGNDGDQPVSIYFDGDNGRPFKPCKTIRRILMGVWGRYANDYVGKSMTLYRDDKVTFGGLETGGIRISHMSHIDKEMMVVVMKSKGKKAGIKIQPLKVEQKADKVADGVRALLDRIAAGEDVAGEEAVQKQRTWLAKNRPELAAEVYAALAGRETGGGDPFGEGPDDTQRGEAHNLDAEADIIAHIKKRVRVEDVNSVVTSRIDELDEGGQERVRAVALAQIEKIREAANA